LHKNVDLTLPADLLDERLQLLVAASLLEELFDLAADLGERRGAGRAALVHFDDVKTEWGFDNAADLAGLQLERRRFECRRHPSLREEAEIAAVLRGAGILRFGARNGREIGAAAHLPQQRLRLAARLRFLRRRGVLGRGDQNVTRVNALVLFETRQVLFVERANVTFLHQRRRRDLRVDDLRDLQLRARLLPHLIDGQPLSAHALPERLFLRERAADVADARVAFLQEASEAMSPSAISDAKVIFINNPSYQPPHLDRRRAASLHSPMPEGSFDDAASGELATNCSLHGRCLPWHRDARPRTVVQAIHRSLARNAGGQLAVVPRSGRPICRTRLRRTLARHAAVRAAHGSVPRVRAVSRRSG